MLREVHFLWNKSVFQFLDAIMDTSTEADKGQSQNIYKIQKKSFKIRKDIFKIQKNIFKIQKNISNLNFFWKSSLKSLSNLQNYYKS